ncbi:hypothetical protein T265_10641 [Opisthorchis viverrini]|uniref:Tetraspanin n=1 Tax=Opisthorchis viverrini TaxID=6198 RepID=A0A074ZCI7_OPIVI|nr:hypothetical protein T265_10641 [Opisthorchis viverrini]KER20915.1 hypothetical protein T265_10641 [Opisthorchis viverrini]
MLVGLVVLGFSVYVSQEPEAQDIIRASGHYVAVQIALYALMGVGGITLITALFGCCGAYHESQCLLGAYFIILLVIFTSQVTGATLGYVFREERHFDLRLLMIICIAISCLDSFPDQIMQHVEQQMFEGVEEYSMLRDQRENPSPFMDNIHRVLQCCGVNGYTDYRDRIPVTCCDRRKSNCNELQLTPDEVYTEGCKEKYKRFFKDKLIVFFLIAVSIAAFEIFCLLFSMVLCCAIRQYHSDYYGVDYAIAT